MPRPRPRLQQGGAQTLPKWSHSRRSRNVSALYKEHIGKCNSLGRLQNWIFKAWGQAASLDPPRGGQSRV